MGFPSRAADNIPGGKAGGAGGAPGGGDASDAVDVGGTPPGNLSERKEIVLIIF